MAGIRAEPQEHGDCEPLDEICGVCAAFGIEMRGCGLAEPCGEALPAGPGADWSACPDPGVLGGADVDGEPLGPGEPASVVLTVGLGDADVEVGVGELLGDDEVGCDGDAIGDALADPEPALQLGDVAGDELPPWLV